MPRPPTSSRSTRRRTSAATKARPNPTGNARRSAATKAALVDAATELFGRDGYAQVGTEQIVKEAQVTRGALYHHFADKRDLFRSVFEEIEQWAVAEVIAKAAGISDPWDVTIAGAKAFLDLCLDPAFQRIAIFDAPSVLGMAESREIADRYGGSLVKALIRALIDAGKIEDQPVEPLARMLTGALIEGGMLIAEAGDKKTARNEVGETVERLMRGLAI